MSCFFLIVFGLIGLAAWHEAWELRRNPESRERQIRELTEALSKAMKTVSVIRDEITEGNALLARLERRTNATKQLSQLSEPQAMAVADQLRDELRAEGRRGLVRDVVLGTIFFGVGVAASRLFG
ncbi:MAG: hypothetical protein ACRDV1_05085 [Actinomycetes bacterium]